MSETDSVKIEPVDFDTSTSPLFSPESASSSSGKPPPLAWLGLGALVILALAVVFVLPAVVSEYELPLERRVETLTTTPPVRSQQPANTISPFEEAQRLRQRKEAQDVLAELLTTQAELDALAVQSWAERDYNQAVELAQQGDDAYIAQEFLVARDNYQEGLTLLQSIVERVPSVLEQNLIEGENALQADNAQVAQEKFAIVLEMDPGNPQAAVGLDRARTLDEVNRIIELALTEQEKSELEAAREYYLDALDLDSRSNRASEGLAEIQRMITEREFSAAMSEGYALLQREQPEQAIQAFQRAAALGVNAAQAQAAIQQTRDEVARVEIERLVQQARSAEADERWQDAVSTYEAMLAIDANLVIAQQGHDYTGKRLNLDQLLERAIDDPLRLADNEVYQQTLDIYYTGRGLENSGPRLTGQLDQLETLLVSSQQQESVSFISDNSTQVTLLRVGEMGAFESRALTLKPGRYVAVGVREGYRDVRSEFVVGYGRTPETVVVQCNERITSSGGR